MTLRLGISTGFAVNRYAEPEEWTRIVRESGVRYVQFTADMLNVSLPAEVVSRQARRIRSACDENGLIISSTFTGAFTRVNHLAHPDPDIRAYWVNWFKRFADLSVFLGSRVMGSHFGIFTMRDDQNPKLRSERRDQNIRCWHEISHYARERGIEQIIWEPMSISREQGETIIACKQLQDDVNVNSPLPFKICLDVDHGDVSSTNPNDTNPYVWLKYFAKESPFIHIKQSSANKGGHWPFTAEHNINGRIIPEKVISVLQEQGVTDAELVLELSFRERQPADSSAPASLRESVDFWRPFVSE
jgi:sugar phosphate isomerase/epimerase